MHDRFIRIAIRHEPIAGFALEDGQLLGQGLFQPLFQQVSEEMMVAVPLSFIIQWNDEQVGIWIADLQNRSGGSGRAR